jgi:hypothetical protein
MPNTLTETFAGPVFLLSELPGYQSRDQIVVAAGADLASGTVLGGPIGSTDEYAAYDPDGADGSETVAGVLYEAAAAADAAVGAVLIARGAEVAADRLVWPDGISDGDKATAIAALEALSPPILVRS